ncbi:restriction endonuclease subunit S [Ligilactobacillus aviarius]|uniref:Type I restriction modification DNA specificity domain-containing protein n=1 Tax=Ligilactobacillus aviarius TaxID=1606 RepID=A0A179CTC3_9LACO|nr:restriction endonuclease subunit S [Ligilactobacillus aviarius]OAQ02536.1 hypothetical protein A3O13_00745 [Ligilactobacillus aviarius]OAQ08318.1 hypothetical protein A3O14_04205 [Ligilactobacillus aviarius]OAS81504.1 hypothetical protein A3O20_03500 [Ligilactobacillus aviarius]PEG71787.1 restriction endonuclease subunit S [Ligilactobacillus aviarius]
MIKADKEGQRKAPILRFKGFTDDWEQRELGQLMEIGSVKRIHMNEWKNTGVPFFRARDIVAKFNNKKISDSIYISEETYNSNILKSGKVKKGQLLITGVGTIGIPYLITDDSPLYFKDGNVIWLKNNNYDGNFIFYFFTTNLFKNYLFKITGTGTVGTYTIENAKKTPISTPQINEQIKIGKLFNILENLLALYDRKLKLLSQVKKYFLDNLFAEKEYPNLRFKYFKKDKWEKTSLNSIVTYSNGKAHEKEINNKGNLDLVMMNSITTGGRLITKKKILSPQDTLNKNDIVIVLSDIAKGELIGKSSVIPCDNQYVLNQRIGCLHPTLNIDSFFVSKYINQKNRYFKSHAAGTSQINLSRSDVLNCTIYIPKVDEQHCVSNFIINVEKIINFYEYKKRHIIQIKNILLNTMFI